MEIIFNNDFIKQDNKNTVRVAPISHGDVYALSKEAVLNLLFEESIYDKFDLKIKGIKDGMLTIQFLERGRENPQKGWSYDEFRTKCENGDFK